jgi:UDP-N-acetylmuramoyl-L-alanyl-D-glutamate--2,6-diaminopimelate ligase
MKSLQDLLSPWLTLPWNIEFQDLHLDSRQVTKGDIFVALPGHEVDGRRFIEEAFRQGAQAVICHTDNPQNHGLCEKTSKPIIYLYHLSQQLGQLAERAYTTTNETMAIAAVTGTNGKTSVTQLMAQLIDLLGEKSAVMGTIGHGLWNQLQPSENTTLDAITMAKNLHEYAEKKVSFVGIEASSHGLVQKRIHTQAINLAILTNITRDHLDYHGDMQNYARAKKRLFLLNQVKYRLFNIDDEVGAKWYQEFKPKAMSYSIDSSKTADYSLNHIVAIQGGYEAQLNTPTQSYQISVPLLGQFNLSNILAGLAGLEMLGYPLSQLIACLPSLTPIAGRMEKFIQVQQPMCVVDFAHTPDALRQALIALKNHCTGQVWCVFGCGGERDHGKRPMMASIAESHADHVVMTADNPRSESVDAILLQMKEGLSKASAATFEPERKKAIQFALKQAKANDIILIAGKGHETYQEINGCKQVYDERDYVQQLLRHAS